MSTTYDERRAERLFYKVKTQTGGSHMAFTMENTEGYTEEQIAALNAELAQRLAEIDPDDVDARQAAEKAFADEVSRR